MCEVAGFFEVPAVALVNRGCDRAPELLGYGSVDNLNGDDRFLRQFKSNFSNDTLDSLTETRFSLVQHDAGSSAYVMIFEQADAAVGPDETQQRLAAVLLPHLVRSLNAARSLTKYSQDTIAVFENVRERLEPATIILDDAGKVSSINAKAIALIKTCNGIRQANGSIELSDPTEANRFTTGLDGLLAGAPVEPFFVRLIAGSDEGDLILMAKQSRETTHGVVIYLRGLLSAPDLVSDCFYKQFGLTPKEQRLANGLMQGKDVQQLAAEFHLSTHTLRTQVRDIFRKTGVNTQAALLVLMLGETLTNFEH